MDFEQQLSWRGRNGFESSSKGVAKYRARDEACDRVGTCDDVAGRMMAIQKGKVAVGSVCVSVCVCV